MRISVCARAPTFAKMATGIPPSYAHDLHLDFAAPPIKRRSLSQLAESGLPSSLVLAHGTVADLPHTET